MWTTSFDDEKTKHTTTIAIEFDKYVEDDETTTIHTGRTLSTVQESPVFLHHEAALSAENCPFLFEKAIKNPDNGRVSRYQNTYFMDGGNRFISLPTLGNTSTKAASHISRVFEDWLQNKLYHQHERLPILEDPVELLAEDIVNKLKSRYSVKGMTGLSQILVKIKTGHVYTYDGQHLITADMQDFFQQFPLFVEILIYAMPKYYETSKDDLQLLLSLENITSNPNEPYYIHWTA